jgi:HAT1-interacting factor 1
MLLIITTLTDTSQLADLRTDPKTLPVDSVDSGVLNGLLNGMLGGDPAEAKAKLEAATKNANDITGLVKTKKKAKAEPAPTDAGSSKRKLETVEEDTDGKRAKTEDLA